MEDSRKPLTGEWQPIETAPKDGTPILGLCVHGADSYFEENGKRLTPYGCHCEGLNRVSDGPHVVVWGDDYQDGDWESGYITIPGWWFRSDSDFEVAANPTHWMPIPDNRAAFPEAFEGAATDKSGFECLVGLTFTRSEDAEDE